MLRMRTDASDPSCCYFSVEIRLALEAFRAAVRKKNSPGVRTYCATRSDPKHPRQSEASAFKSSLSVASPSPGYLSRRMS